MRSWGGRIIFCLVTWQKQRRISWWNHRMSGMGIWHYCYYRLEGTAGNCAILFLFDLRSIEIPIRKLYGCKMLNDRFISSCKPRHFCYTLCFRWLPLPNIFCIIIFLKYLFQMGFLRTFNEATKVRNISKIVNCYGASLLASLSYLYSKWKWLETSHRPFMTLPFGIFCHICT